MGKLFHCSLKPFILKNYMIEDTFDFTKVNSQKILNQL